MHIWTHNDFYFFSQIIEEEEKEMELTEKPYLLLDIRPTEQYESGHIVSARSYPHVRVARAVNFETQEMLYYKVIGMYSYNRNSSLTE